MVVIGTLLLSVFCGAAWSVGVWVSFGLTSTGSAFVTGISAAIAAISNRGFYCFFFLSELSI